MYYAYFLYFNPPRQVFLFDVGFFWNAQLRPKLNGVKMSRNNGSCESPESMLNLSSCFSPNSCACHFTKWVNGRWAPTIALGFPVEPEVKAIYASWSESISRFN